MHIYYVLHATGGGGGGGLNRMYVLNGRPRSLCAIAGLHNEQHTNRYCNPV